MELSVILGVALGLGGILFGNAIEDGHFGSLIQGTAALIVFGGTFGATLVSNSFADIRLSFQYLREIFKSRDEGRRKRMAIEIVNCAKLARKESLLAVEQRIKTFESDYMRNVFRFMIDGAEADRIYDIFMSDIEVYEKRSMSAARVWSDAGGYAPTIGIIGAVLGLIHVMANLSNTSELGKGIAVAFVATIYGVGSANLFFIPFSNRIKRIIDLECEEKEMVVVGAISILNGLNPHMIEEKMRTYTKEVVVS